MRTSETNRTATHAKRRGSAMLELVLLGPWIFFLFVGVLDWGFYSYALICLQSAARTAALYTSTNAGTAADATNACRLVLAEMKSLPNVGSVCGSNPVVTAAAISGPDSAAATSVAVTYTSVSLIPIPGILRQQFTITRVVKMRLRT